MSDVAPPSRPRTLGFIGTGHITSCMVAGLMTCAHPPAAIVVSPRNLAIAKSLADRFTSVTVAADNQEVVDACEAIFLAVRPRLAQEVVEPLAFRPEQLVVSLMATIPLAQLEAWVGPVDALVRALPLPPVARGAGPTAITPDEPRVRTLFDSVGMAVPSADEVAFERLAALTAMAAPFYQLLEICAHWATENGVPKATAARYTAALFHGLAADSMETGERGFAPFVDGLAIPHSLNQQGLAAVREAGGFTAFESALSQVLARIEKDD